MQFATVQPIIARPDLPVITDEEAAALARTTVNQFRAWGLSDAEARVLLGDMAQRTWALWAPTFLVGASGTALAGGITWLAQGAETDRMPGTGVTTLGIISGACLITAGIFALVVPETTLSIEPMP